MSAIGFIKEHPIGTGVAAIVLVGGFFILRGGSASANSGDAYAAASQEAVAAGLQLQREQNQLALASSQIGAQRDVALDTNATNLALGKLAAEIQGQKVASDAASLDLANTLQYQLQYSLGQMSEEVSLATLAAQQGITESNNATTLAIQESNNSLAYNLQASNNQTLQNMNESNNLTMLWVNQTNADAMTAMNQSNNEAQTTQAKYYTDAQNYGAEVSLAQTRMYTDAVEITGAQNASRDVQLATIAANAGVANTRTAANAQVATAQANNSGGCFLTTIVCETLGKPDDCEELTVLRGYRESFLKASPWGCALVGNYRIVGPRIVDAINNLSEQWRRDKCAHLYASFIAPAVAAVKEGDNFGALAIYIRLVNECMEI
jgi:hypothetical protein